MMALVWSLLGIRVRHVHCLAGADQRRARPRSWIAGRGRGGVVPCRVAWCSSPSRWRIGQAQGVSIAWRAPPFWMLVGGGLLGAAYVTA